MKKTTLSFIAIFLISIQLTGQNTFLRERKIYIGIFASPDYSYQILGNGNLDYLVKQRREYEKPAMAFTLGGEILYQINSKIAMTFGLVYSVKRIKTKYYEDFVYQTPSPTEPIKGKYIYNTSYAEIPIRIDFYLSKKKIAPFITTGISTNIYLTDLLKATYSYQDGHERISRSSGRSGLFPIDPQIQVGAGIDAIINNSRLRAFPLFRMSIFSKGLGVSDRFFSVGLGLSYYFKV